MPQYEWDENKNKSNQQKHSISFEKAKSARQASKEETKSYLENSLSKQSDDESES